MSLCRQRELGGWKSLLFVVVIVHLSVLLQELGVGPFLLRAPGSGPAEDAHLSRVGIDHNVRLNHRGEAQVPERRTRSIDELVRPLRPHGQRHVVTLRDPDLLPLLLADAQRARAFQHVDGFLVGEVVVARERRAPRRHLVVAAPHPLAAGGRAELLAAVAELLPVGLLAPPEITFAYDVAGTICHTCAPLGRCSRAQSPRLWRAGQGQSTRAGPAPYSLECVEGEFSEVPGLEGQDSTKEP